MPVILEPILPLTLLATNHDKLMAPSLSQYLTAYTKLLDFVMADPAQTSRFNDQVLALAGHDDQPDPEAKAIELGNEQAEVPARDEAAYAMNRWERRIRFWRIAWTE